MVIQGTTIVDILAWLLGGIIIAIFSWNYFNLETYSFEIQKKGNGKKPVFSEPVLPRFATSPARYWKWFSIFLFFTFLLYYLVANFLDRQVGSNPSTTALEWYKSYNQIFAALLISGLANIVPKELGIIDILRLLRNFTHMRAKIPERALTIFRNIMNHNLNISEYDLSLAVNFVGSDFLTEKDFIDSQDPSEQNTIEKNWTKTCHLKTQIHFLSENTESKYAKILSKPELVFDQAQQNFNIIKEDIKNYKRHEPDTSISSLRDRTRGLLKQFSKLMVCLVFASETKEELIYKKLQQLGINCRKKPRYEINISFLFAGLTAFACIILIIAYVLGMQIEKTNIDATKASLIGIAAVFVICAPLMSVFGIKLVSDEFWPIRGQFSIRQPTPPILMFFLGIGVGILGLYFTDYIGLFDKNNWAHYLPYTVLSGLGAIMAAVVIDNKPRLWKWGAALQRALLLGIIGSLLFFVFGTMATIIMKNITGTHLTWSFFKDQAFTLILLSSVGFISGVVISLLSEYAVRLRNMSEELSLNLSEYLLPALGYENVMNLNYSNLKQLFHTQKGSLPSKFDAYLVDKGILSQEGELTEQSYHLLKADLKKAA